MTEPSPEDIQKFKENYPHLSNLSLMHVMLRLCHVPRWGVIPMGRPQSVAEHSYRVAAIAAALVQGISDRIIPSKGFISLLMESVWGAVIHDCDEVVSGDIPSPYRRLMGINSGIAKKLCPSIPALEPLGEEVVWVVKMADMIEATTYLRMWGRSVDGVDIRQVKAANIKNHLRVRLDSCPFKDKEYVEEVVLKMVEDIAGGE